MTTEACATCAAYKADHDLLESILKTVRPEHLAFLKMAVPPDLFAKIAERAKAVVR